MMNEQRDLLYRKQFMDIYHMADTRSLNENIKACIDVLTKEDGSLKENIESDLLQTIGNDFIYHGLSSCDNQDKNPINYMTAFCVEQVGIVREIRQDLKKVTESLFIGKLGINQYMNTSLLSDKELLTSHLTDYMTKQPYQFNKEESPVSMTGYWLCGFGEKALEGREETLNHYQLKEEPFLSHDGARVRIALEQMEEPSLEHTPMFMDDMTLDEVDMEY